MKHELDLYGALSKYSTCEREGSKVGAREWDEVPVEQARGAGARAGRT